MPLRRCGKCLLFQMAAQRLGTPAPSLLPLLELPLQVLLGLPALFRPCRWLLIAVGMHVAKELFVEQTAGRYIAASTL